MNKMILWLVTLCAIGAFGVSLAQDTYYVCTTKGRDVLMVAAGKRKSIRTTVSPWSLFAPDIWSPTEAEALKNALARGFISLNDSKFPLVSAEQARMFVGEEKEAALAKTDQKLWGDLQEKKATRMAIIPKAVALFSEQLRYSQGIARMLNNFHAVYNDLLRSFGIVVDNDDVMLEHVQHICQRKAPNGFLPAGSTWDGVPLKLEPRRDAQFLCGDNKAQPKFVVAPALQDLAEGTSGEFVMTVPKDDHAKLKCQHFHGNSAVVFDKILIDPAEAGRTLDVYATMAVRSEYPDLRTSRPTTPADSSGSSSARDSSPSGSTSVPSSATPSPRSVGVVQDLYDVHIDPSQAKPFRLSIGQMAKRSPRASFIVPTVFYACRYADSESSKTALDFSRSNPAALWWSTPELLRVHNALHRFGLDITASELSIVGVANGLTVPTEITMPVLVGMCKEKDVAYEWAEKLPAVGEELFYCNGNRNHQVIMPTQDVMFAQRKCQWLYGEDTAHLIPFDGHQADVYAHRVAAKLAGKKPSETHSSPVLPAQTVTTEVATGSLSDLVSV